jgi:hypothetical protein
MDAYAKIVLTVIAACLALQVAQGFGLAAPPGSGEVNSSSAVTGDRFQMLPIGMARQLFRLDRATGQTSTMPLQPEENLFWTPVEETPPKAMARKKRKKAPLQPKKKADGAEK